jgi:dimethylamine monooxygenase subunit A
LPDYLPFPEGPFRLAMGLLNLDPADWIEIDGNFVAELRLKRQLLAERHEACFLALPGAEPGGAETLEMLAAHLPVRFPEIYRPDGDALQIAPLGESWDLRRTDLHPLDLAARLVQEDLCLMRPDGDTHVLAALSVCFPSRWRIADKLGKKLRDVHAPVAFYDERLARPVDRFFAHLKEDKPVQRLNWNLHDDSALFQPVGHNRQVRDPSITAENAGERLFIRAERQTLRRLPRSRDVLFGIRTYVRKLGEIAGRPDDCERLAAAIRAVPDATARYKSLPVFAEAALGWLDHHAGAAVLLRTAS